MIVDVCLVILYTVYDFVQLISLEDPFFSLKVR